MQSRKFYKIDEQGNLNVHRGNISRTFHPIPAADMPPKVSTLCDMIAVTDVKKYWLTLSEENVEKHPFQVTP